jgi:hypothetical protein
MDARGGRAGCTLDRKASPTENALKRTSSRGKIRLRITVGPYNLSVEITSADIYPFTVFVGNALTQEKLSRLDLNRSLLKQASVPCNV